MEVKYSNNKEAFEKASKSVESVLSLSNQNIRFGHDSIFFDLGNIHLSLVEFDSLISSEFYENPEIFSSLASAIREFYFQNDGNDILCDVLKSKYFNDSFEKNILFKYLIIIHDPQGRMRECIVQDDYQIEFLKASQSAEMITLEYLEELKVKGPNNIEIRDYDYINTFTIKFFLRNGRKFQIEESNSLVLILRVLKREGLLRLEILRMILDFKSSQGKSLGWDQEKFEYYIEEFKNKSLLGVLDLELKEYLNLIDYQL